MQDFAVVWDINGVIFKNYSLDKDTLGIVKDLFSIGCKQYVCTNTRITRMDSLEKLLNSFGYFEEIFSSARLGLTKPDCRVYEYLKENIPYKTLYFIDDSPQNIAVANEMGLYGIRYVSDINLKEDFKLLGIYKDDK